MNVDTHSEIKHEAMDIGENLQGSDKVSNKEEKESVETEEEQLKMRQMWGVREAAEEVKNQKNYHVTALRSVDKISHDAGAQLELNANNEEEAEVKHETDLGCEELSEVKDSYDPSSEEWCNVKQEPYTHDENLDDVDDSRDNDHAGDEEKLEENLMIKPFDSDLKNSNLLNIGDKQSSLGEYSSTPNSLQGTGLSHVFECPDCKFSHSTIQELQSHMTTHSTQLKSIPGTVGQCRICAGNALDRSLRTARRIQNMKNMKIAHEKRYSCDMCHYTSRDTVTMKRHKMRHRGEMPFSCDICHYTSMNCWHMKQHKMTHTGEKPYSCDLCLYKCTRAGTMKRHKMRHRGEVLYSCDICDYTSMTVWHMKQHKMIHSDEKPYSCNMCQYTCRSAGNMKQHIKVHRAEKPYSCDV